MAVVLLGATMASRLGSRIVAFAAFTACVAGSGWQSGNPRDVTPVGEGVSKLRDRLRAGLPGVLQEAGRTVVILLAGGDKRSQSDDIETALRLARNL